MAESTEDTDSEWFLFVSRGTVKEDDLSLVGVLYDTERTNFAGVAKETDCLLSDILNESAYRVG